MNLCDMRTIKEIMRVFGIAPKKGFGQNFLINASVPERIAEECCDDADSVIVEIGPGIGCLTAELAKRYKKVIAFEIDTELMPVLKYTLGEYGNVEIINEDIMKADICAILDERAKGEKISVCANLPYYITTPILMRLVESGIPFDSITIMIQAEVASRLSASAGSSEYGAITASLNYYGLPTKLFSVSAGNFLPAPKVNSAVVRIDLYKDKPVKPKNEQAFFGTIKAAFGQRRKTLSNAITAVYPNLSKGEVEQALISLGFSEKVRGERLSTKDFADLSDILFGG